MTSQIMKISKSDSIKNSYHMLALSFADFVEDLKNFINYHLHMKNIINLIIIHKVI